MDYFPKDEKKESEVSSRPNFQEEELKELSGRTSELLTKINRLSSLFSKETPEKTDFPELNKEINKKIGNKPTLLDTNSARSAFSSGPTSSPTKFPFSDDSDSLEQESPKISYLRQHREQVSSEINGKRYLKKTSAQTFFQSANQKEERQLFDYSFQDKIPDIQEELQFLPQTRRNSPPQGGENTTKRIFSEQKESEIEEKILSNPRYKPRKYYLDLKEFQQEEKQAAPPLSATRNLRQERLQEEKRESYDHRALEEELRKERKEREERRERAERKNQEQSIPQESELSELKVSKENRKERQALLEELERVEKNLHKVSATFRKNSNLKLDIIKILAWLAPVFAISFPFNLIKLLGLSFFDHFLIFLSLLSMSLFFGIFALKIALKIVEISEISNWSHKQVFLLKSILNKDQS